MWILPRANSHFLNEETEVLRIYFSQVTKCERVKTKTQFAFTTNNVGDTFKHRFRKDNYQKIYNLQDFR